MKRPNIALRTLSFLLLLFVAAPGAMAEIVDNSDSGFSISGLWGASSFMSGYYGEDYRFSAPGYGSRQATWTFSASTGLYEISARWSAFENRASNAMYRVYNNGLEIDSQEFDQRFDGGQFNSFSLPYDVQAGTLEVVLSDQADGYVVADARPFTLEAVEISRRMA